MKVKRNDCALKSKILNILVDSEPLTLREIFELSTHRNYKTVSTSVYRYYKYGYLERTGNRGNYRYCLSALGEAHAENPLLSRQNFYNKIIQKYGSSLALRFLDDIDYSDELIGEFVDRHNIHLVDEKDNTDYSKISNLKQKLESIESEKQELQSRLDEQKQELESKYKEIIDKKEQESQYLENKVSELQKTQRITIPKGNIPNNPERKPEPAKPKKNKNVDRCKLVEHVINNKLPLDSVFYERLKHFVPYTIPKRALEHVNLKRAGVHILPYTMVKQLEDIGVGHRLTSSQINNQFVSNLFIDKKGNVNIRYRVSKNNFELKKILPASDYRNYLDSKSKKSKSPTSTNRKIPKNW